MKFKTLNRRSPLQVAGDFPVPFADASPQGGNGGPTTDEGARPPAGQPPYTAPAGSQDDKAVKPTRRTRATQQEQGPHEQDDKGRRAQRHRRQQRHTPARRGNMGSGSKQRSGPPRDRKEPERRRTGLDRPAPQPKQPPTRRSRAQRIRSGGAREEPGAFFAGSLENRVKNLFSRSNADGAALPPPTRRAPRARSNAHRRRHGRGGHSLAREKCSAPKATHHAAIYDVGRLAARWSGERPPERRTPSETACERAERNSLRSCSPPHQGRRRHGFDLGKRDRS